MKKRVFCSIIAVLLLSTVLGCHSSKNIGILTREEIRKSEVLYGKNKGTVFREFGYTDQDIEAGTDQDFYLGMSKTRIISGLTFQYRLAFNKTEKDLVYVGEDLAFVAETEKVSDEEFHKALESIYKEVIIQYGEPDNDPDVGITHLADLIHNPAQYNDDNYTVVDNWVLSEKSDFTINVKVMSGWKTVTLSYRQKRSLQLEQTE